MAIIKAPIPSQAVFAKMSGEKFNEKILRMRITPPFRSAPVSNAPPSGARLVVIAQNEGLGGNYLGSVRLAKELGRG